MFYTYILQSLKDGRFYIGYTANIDQRLMNHNAGMTQSTKSRIPWKVVYYKTFQDKTDAILRERFLKAQRNRAFYERLINGFKPNGS